MSVMSQEEYIAILFNDLGFDSAARRVWLKLEFGHSYPDELNAQTKHQVIERLKLMKEDQGGGDA